MKKFIEVYNNIEKYPTLKSVSDVLGISERTVRRKAKKLREDGVELVDRSSIKSNTVHDLSHVDIQTQVQLRQLNERVSSLTKQLKEAHKEISSSQVLKDLIHEVKNAKPDVIPNWLQKKHKNKNSLTGIPVLFLSDIHFDEVVEASQVGNVNVFNRSIAEERLKYTFETSISLLKEHMTDANYDGFVLALGGDLLSGAIHDELAETNEYPILLSVSRLTDILISGIKNIKKEFGKVFVPCVVGNHGRIHQQKRTKNKVFDNYEWIIYHNLAKYFENDSDISFHIPDSIDAQFSIYNTKFLMEHGDSFRGGSGIAGIFSPLMLGIHKKNKNKSSVNRPFDVMMIGHFHQYIHTNNLIVNGSVKGYDTYAYNNNFPFEPPQQALFIVHPTYGITFRMPIRCDGYELTDSINTAKISVVF